MNNVCNKGPANCTRGQLTVSYLALFSFLVMHIDFSNVALDISETGWWARVLEWSRGGVLCQLYMHDLETWLALSSDTIPGQGPLGSLTPRISLSTAFGRDSLHKGQDKCRYTDNGVL
jgi:hypothetical protein